MYFQSFDELPPLNITCVHTSTDLPSLKFTTVSISLTVNPSTFASFVIIIVPLGLSLICFSIELWSSFVSPVTTNGENLVDENTSSIA